MAVAGAGNYASREMARLAAVPLALIALSTGGAAGLGEAEEPPRARQTAPSFTDDDLARYREQRLRELEPEGDVVAPAPARPTEVTIPAPRSEAPTSGVSVVLQDLNRTLPLEAREVAEAAGRQFVTFFEVPVQGELVIPLRFFPDMEEYRTHLARNIPGEVMWTGYFDPRKGEIVVGGSRDSLAILIHEINHFIVDRVFEEAPVWFDEGLAEYFEGTQPEDGGLVVREPDHHRRRLAEWLAGDRRPDLRQLLGTGGWTSFGPGFAHERLVRALSWSVVDFLMQEQEGRQTLRAFMARLKDHRGLHSLEALDRTFPGGAAAFERRWLEHVEARAEGR